MKKMARSTTAVFHTITSQTMAGGVLTLSAQPSTISPRLNTECDAFAFYRIRSLKFRLHPPAAHQYNAGWVPGYPNTPPSTLAQVGELIEATVINATYSVPSSWVKVAKSSLSGPLPWYKTVSGTDAADFEVPGSIVVVGVSTDVVLIEIEGVYEFKEPIATANTPEQIALQQRIRLLGEESAKAVARDRMLKVLSPASGNTRPPPP
jgi:hypothetical protein